METHSEHMSGTRGRLQLLVKIPVEPESPIFIFTHTPPHFCQMVRCQLSIRTEAVPPPRRRNVRAVQERPAFPRPPCVGSRTIRKATPLTQPPATSLTPPLTSLCPEPEFLLSSREPMTLRPHRLRRSLPTPPELWGMAGRTILIQTSPITLQPK